jgi:flagellar biosynthesis protein
MDKENKINIRQKAVAIQYDVKKVAPNVLAKGQGYLAEKLLEKGKQANVPIYKDSELVEELSKIDIGENIPPELYEVVAQVLTFISDLDKLQEKMNGR